MSIYRYSHRNKNIDAEQCGALSGFDCIYTSCKKARRQKFLARPRNIIEYFLNADDPI
jgi:hypothetical protein